MSASLVGSEMCIRDSPLPVLSVPLPSTVPHRAEGIPPATLFCCLACSVSYTHLTLPTICSV
eukprot:9717720-Alexandrium_andersonii.AAC.1